jgi:hypothetical protein
VLEISSGFRLFEPYTPLTVAVPIDSIEWTLVLDEVHIACVQSWHWIQTSVLKIRDFKAG